MKEYNLRPLWDATLEIYDVFATICKRHNLRFFVAYGSALGAVRHKGFIPWDDDLDVQMPRPDYDKFMEIAEYELPSYYKVCSYKNDPTYYNVFNFIKDMRENRTEILRKKTGLSGIRSVYMDIFPVDGFPYTGYRYWGYRVKLFLWSCLYGNMFSNSKERRISWNLRSIVGKIMGRCLHISTMKECLDYMDAWSRSNLYENCDSVAYLIEYCSIWQKKWFAHEAPADFEGRRVPLPVGWHEILKSAYGDYMQLPPIEKRRPSHQN